MKIKNPFYLCVSRYVCMILLALLLINFSNSVGYAEGYTIPDEGFRNYILQLCDNHTGELSEDDLALLSNMTWLVIYKKHNVESIEGIELFSSLEELILLSTTIKDLEPLTKLSKLESLSLLHTEIDDLSPISKITSLRSFDASRISNNDKCFNKTCGLISMTPPA